MIPFLAVGFALCAGLFLGAVAVALWLVDAVEVRL